MSSDGEILDVIKAVTKSVVYIARVSLSVVRGKQRWKVDLLIEGSP